MTEFNEDINIDQNLKIISDSKNPSEFVLTNFTNEKGRKISGGYQSKQFAKLMEREGLVRIFGDFCALEKFGFQVQKNGGWLKQLADQKLKQDQIEISQQKKENLELENLALQKETADYHKSIRKKEYEIRELTKANLRLNNWDIRFRWIISIITFIIGFLLNYIIKN